jgi:PAS domain S-box-containing protein
MKDENKTKKQLIAELTQLRPRVAELEKIEDEYWQTEATLQESQARYRTLFDNAGDAIFIHDLSGRFLEVNQVACERLGYSQEELLQMTPMDIDSKEYAALVKERIEMLRQQGHVLFETAHVRRDGTIIPIELSSRVIEYAGKPAILSIARDISERKQVEKLLRIQRDLAFALSSTSNLTEALNRLLDTTMQIEGIDSGGVYLVDRHTNELRLAAYKGLSPQFIERVSYYDADAPQARLVLAGKPIYQSYSEIFPTIDKVRQSEGLRTLTVIPVKYEEQVVAALNLSSHIHDEIPVRARNILEAIAAQIGGAIARVRAEEARRESEERFRSFFEGAPDAIMLADPESGQILDANPAASQLLLRPREEIIDLHHSQLHPTEREVYSQEAFAKHVQQTQQGGKTQPIENLVLRSDGSTTSVEILAQMIHLQGKPVLQSTFRDITERKRVEETLLQRNRELAMLNQAGRALTSSLDLDQVLVSVLEEVQHLPDVLACSIWLVDSETNELVCRQVTDPQSTLVRGWRLAPGQGLAGWVVEHKQSLNVPDVQADKRHFKGVDEQTGLKLRSILTVPLQVKEKVIGVMQLVDEEVGRFNATHQTLLESLAATAAIAIQNAQLYEQARQDAKTKLTLLHEVNHRIKNNLTAIIGLLYAERHHAKIEDRTYQDILNALINRVQGLATVHELLSASEWRSLFLSDLARQIIHAASHVLSPSQQVLVDVSPSPVKVSPTQANHLALVINELATNSLKYALPERNKVQITVRIALEEKMIRLQFQDNGPGYPEAVLKSKHQNVGLYLMQTIVSSSLQGEVALHNDNGAVTVIRFKMMQ